jgi:hypothetical protein
MIAKCPCQHCGVNIEFEVENGNQFVPCPSCGKQTRLLLPKPSATRPKFERLAPELKLQACEDCGGEISRKSVLCPHCGKFINVPFRLVWMAVGYSICAFALFDLIRLLMDAVFKAFTS